MTKTLVVVGGTSGIGASIARKAAQDHGMRVVAAGRRSPRAVEGVEHRALDIADPKGIVAFFERLGEVDYLVTAGSFVRPGPFKTSPIADARTSMDGKFFSQYECARAAAVRESVLFFSGVLSRRAGAGYASLAAVNAAVEGLGRALAVELAPIRFNTISPGLVRDTGAYLGMPETARERMFGASADRLPVRFVSGPDAVADMALAVLTNPYVTGTVVDVDGGALLV